MELPPEEDPRKVAYWRKRAKERQYPEHQPGEQSFESGTVWINESETILSVEVTCICGITGLYRGPIGLPVQCPECEQAWNIAFVLDITPWFDHERPGDLEPTPDPVMLDYPDDQELE